MVAETIRRIVAGTGSSSHRRNLLWNALGTFTPLVAAAVSIPFLISGMGTERFGILSLAWVIVGYFSFFDLGLGRAMTQLISQSIGSGSEARIPAIAQGGTVLMGALGLASGLLVAALSPWLVDGVLAISPALAGETLWSLFILSASIPVVIVSTGLRGILEARLRFDAVNIVRAPLGALTYLGPLLVIAFTNQLPAVIAVLVAGRVLSLIAYAAVCARLYPELLRLERVDRLLLTRLLGYGGWITLSNIAGPLLLYGGRFALVVLVSAEAVAYFATPYEVVISVLLIPGIFVGVLFPMFAERFRSKPEEVGHLYRRAMVLNLVLVLPICFLIVLLAEPGMTLWVGADFASHSFRVAQLLALGVFINSFGYYAQALVQAYGRPDLTAKLHLVELIMYVPYMLWLVDTEGVDGAAMAWVIRVAISTLILVPMASACLRGRLAPPGRSQA